MTCTYCDEPLDLEAQQDGVCSDCQEDIDLENAIYEEELHESSKVFDYEDE